MAQPTVDHDITADEIRVALSLIELGGERVNSAAVVLARGDPMRVVWANAATVRLLGRGDAAQLSAALFGDEPNGPPFAVGLRRLVAYTLPRLERLRLRSGFRTRSVTAEISRTTLANGQPLYGIVVPGVTPGDGEEWSRSVLAAGTDRPPDDGTRPHAHEVAEAGRDVAGPHDLGSEIRDDAAEPDRGLPAPAVQVERAVRLTWRTDGSGRLTTMASHAAALARAVDDRLIGRVLTEAVQSGGGDPEGLFAAALGARDTFSGLAVAWPLRDGRTVAVHAGGVPVFAADGLFQGFRGFAVAHPVRGAVLPEPSPVSTAPDRRAGRDAAPPLPEPRDDAATLDAPPPEAPAAALPGPAAQRPAPAEAPRRAEPRRATDAVAGTALPPSTGRGAGTASPKVVPLRPYRVLAPDPEMPAQVPDPGTAAGDLSVLERSAFQEIGRALAGHGDAPASDPGDAPSHPAGTHLGSEVEPVLDRDDAASGPTFGSEAHLLQMLPVPVLVVRDGLIASCNQAFLDLAGYGSAEQINDRGGLDHLLDGEALDRAGPSAAYRRFRVLDRDGQAVTVEGRVAAAPTPEGTVRLLVLGRVVDLRDEAAPAQPREPERDDFRDLFEALADPAALLDDGGRVLALNRVGETLFGRGGAEIAGQVFTVLAAPDHRAAAAAVIDHLRAAEPRDEARLDLLGLTSGGHVLPLRMAVRRIGAGRFGVTWRDLSAHANLEDALADATRQLRLAQAAKADFLARLSYEVRSPLTAIQGFAEIILDERFGPLGNERYREYLRDIRQAGASVLDLVNGLLDLARMESGQAAMSPAPLDANRIIGEIVADLQPQANRGRVIMRMSLMPGLPAALVDERAFRQMVANVLSNAVRFNEPGGQVIVSTALGEGGSVAVRVRDTGVGMSDDEVAAALEPFRPGATAPAGSRDGNGLGLPLAKAMADANQAVLSISSRKHEGTLVEIMLRAEPSHPVQIPAE